MGYLNYMYYFPPLAGGVGKYALLNSPLKHAHWYVHSLLRLFKWGLNS